MGDILVIKLEGDEEARSDAINEAIANDCKLITVDNDYAYLETG